MFCNTSEDLSSKFKSFNCSSTPAGWSVDPLGWQSASDYVCLVLQSVPSCWATTPLTPLQCLYVITQAISFSTYENCHLQSSNPSPHSRSSCPWSQWPGWVVIALLRVLIPRVFPLHVVSACLFGPYVHNRSPAPRRQGLQTRVSEQLSRQPPLLIISRASGAGHFQGCKVFSRTFSGSRSPREY